MRSVLGGFAGLGPIFRQASYPAAEVRRAPVGPGLRPGPRRQARRVCRGLRGQRRAAGASRATKPPFRRSRSDSCRARRAAFAPILSFELGVPESSLSIDSRRSSSATRSSSRRSRSRDVSRPAVSTAICASFASITARSRATRSPCSPTAPGPLDTSRKHAQPALKVQPPAHVGVSRSDPVNGHPRLLQSQSCSTFHEIWHDDGHAMGICDIGPCGHRWHEPGCMAYRQMADHQPETKPRRRGYTRPACRKDRALCGFPYGISCVFCYKHLINRQDSRAGPDYL